MESDAFMNHKIDTDWLDMRIAQKDQVRASLISIQSVISFK